jgi:hypothetical protein
MLCDANQLFTVYYLTLTYHRINIQDVRKMYIFYE